MIEKEVGCGYLQVDTDWVYDTVPRVIVTKVANGLLIADTDKLVVVVDATDSH